MENSECTSSLYFWMIKYVSLWVKDSLYQIIKTVFQIILLLVITKPLNFRWTYMCSIDKRDFVIPNDFNILMDKMWWKIHLLAGHQCLMPIIPATQEVEIRRITVHIVLETLPWKNPTQKMDGRVVGVVECLPGKCEALSSNSSSTKKKKRRETHSQKEKCVFCCKKGQYI
jgi:hypothetical protein